MDRCRLRRRNIITDNWAGTKGFRECLLFFARSLTDSLALFAIKNYDAKHMPNVKAYGLRVTAFALDLYMFSLSIGLIHFRLLNMFSK